MMPLLRDTHHTQNLSQCDQIGLSFKGHGDNFYAKVAQNILRLFELFWKTSPFSKIC